MGSQDIRKILCPTDFSPFSARAFEYAVLLADLYGAAIEALHVFPLIVNMPGDVTYSSAMVRLDEATRGALMRDLRNFTNPARNRGIFAAVRVMEGDPSNLILGLAEKESTDLIVMGTHGHRGFDRWLMGSVAERVLIRAQCPVLTVTRAPETDVPPQAPVIERILCPVDLSEFSAESLRFALSLARRSGASVALLHVVDEMPVGGGPRDRAASGSLDIERSPAEVEARCRLDDLLRTVDAVGPIEKLVVGGRDIEMILRVAAEIRSDLIVMGVHGRRSSGMTVLGRTASHVVRESTCPVLTVRCAD